MHERLQEIWRDPTHEHATRGYRERGADYTAGKGLPEGKDINGEMKTEWTGYDRN